MVSTIRGNDNFDSASAGSTTFGGVGSYAWCFSTTASTTGIASNTSFAGSGLRYNGYTTSNPYNGNPYSYGNTAPAAPSGTWRSMGHSSDNRYNHYNATLFVRISQMSISIIQVRNAASLDPDNLRMNVEINHPNYGWIPYTVDPSRS